MHLAGFVEGVNQLVHPPPPGYGPDLMQVCSLLQTDNHASTSPVSFFFRARCFPVAQIIRAVVECVESTSAVLMLWQPFVFIGLVFIRDQQENKNFSAVQEIGWKEHLRNCQLRCKAVTPTINQSRKQDVMNIFF